MPETIEISHPDPVTVSDYVAQHLNMVADLTPAEVQRIAREARRVASGAERAAKRAGRV